MPPMPPPSATRNPAHKTRARDRKLAYLLRLATDRPTGFRAAPVLADFPGAVGDGRPPVRIFIGSEPRQARAERVLVWSILKHRDPDRAQEVHLMKDLAGFGRRAWKTGFTNYRYGVPAMAGGVGRAIYNDVDQVYLADPALLFDLPMGGAGALGVSGYETSVLLLDCARMAEAWPDAAARAPRPAHPIYRALRDAAGLWGPLPAAWNHMDEEYRPGETGVLHFTTLHTQPWRPFPEELRYRPHPHADIWDALEREADAAGFTIFTASRPSADFQGIGAPSPARRDLGAIARLLDGAAEASLALLTHAPAAPELPGLAATVAPLAPQGPDLSSAAGVPAAAGAVALGGLEAAPEDDTPWLLDRLFEAGRRFVYVAVECGQTDGRSAATAAALPAAWWRGQMEAAARRRPGRSWRLVCREGRWRTRNFQG